MSTAENDAMMKHYYEYFQPLGLEYLRGAFRGIFKLEPEQQKTVLREVGKACFEINRKNIEAVYEEYPTNLTLEEAAAWNRYNQHLNESMKREFYKEVDGEQVLVREREFECYREGNTIVADSGTCRLFHNTCACGLVQLGIAEANPAMCRYCQEGLQAAQMEYLTGGKVAIDFEAPETPIVCGYGSGCDVCRAVLHYKPEDFEK